MVRHRRHHNQFIVGRRLQNLPSQMDFIDVVAPLGDQDSRVLGHIYVRVVDDSDEEIQVENHKEQQLDAKQEPDNANAEL